MNEDLDIDVENILNFSFLKDNPGDICFSNSGGPDSAIIYYALAKFIKENNLNISIFHFTVDTQTKFWYIEHAKKVIDYIKNEFNIVPALHLTLDNVRVTEDKKTKMPIGYAEAQRYLADQLIRRNTSIKYVIGGSSNMLPVKYLENAKKTNNKKYGHLKYVDENRKTIEDGGTVKPTLEKLGDNISAYLPFVNLDKRYVKKLYDFYGLTHTLFPITRSCEAKSTSLGYKGQKHCGKCIFCFEREITFGFLE